MPLISVNDSGAGDAGKSRAIDYLYRQKKAGMVIRINGGHNRGGTIHADGVKFICHIMPSGCLDPDCMNVIAPTVALSIPQLLSEMDELNNLGFYPKLAISDRANLILPNHIELNAIEEESLGKDKFGSTVRGVTQSYADFIQKRALRVCDLYEDDDYILSVIDKIYDNLTSIYYGFLENGTISKHDITSPEETLEQIKSYRVRIKPYVMDTRLLIKKYLEEGGTALTEHQLGSTRSLEHGIYPHITSSCCLSSYAPVACGVSSHYLTDSITLIKSYCTYVGSGPMPTELYGEEAERLRNLGNEFGSTTGRPRRCGWLCLPEVKFGVEIQGATDIFLTKMDVLSDYDKLKVCVGFMYMSGPNKGNTTKDFPVTKDLERVDPIYQIMDGWQCDISNIRKYYDLPENAKKYIENIERFIKMPIRYISVGKERDAVIDRLDEDFFFYDMYTEYKYGKLELQNV